MASPTLLPAVALTVLLLLGSSQMQMGHELLALKWIGKKMYFRTNPFSSKSSLKEPNKGLHLMFPVWDLMQKVLHPHDDSRSRQHPVIIKPSDKAFHQENSTQDSRAATPLCWGQTVALVSVFPFLWLVFFPIKRFVVHSIPTDLKKCCLCSSPCFSCNSKGRGCLWF